MADSAVAVTAGTGTNIDTRTESTNGNHRQVIVIGDPATNAGVAPVDATNGLAVDVKQSALPTGAATSAKQDTGNTSLGTIAGAVSGTEMQVDVVTMPTTTVQATNLDIRDLSSASDSVAAAQSGTWNITNVSGTVSLPTGAATAAKQPSLGTAGTASTDVITIQGIASMTPVLVDASATTQPISAASLPLPSGAATSAKQDTGNTSLGTIAGAVSGTEMQVDVLTMPTTTVQATNLDIRDLTSASDSVAAVQSGTWNIGTVTAVTAISNALPAGTNAIGKLAANSGVDIGDVDVTSLPALAAGTNAIGKLLPPDVDVTAHANYARKYYTNAGAVTDGIVWSPAAGKRWHVTTLYIQVSAAATVTLEDDKAGGDDPVWKAELAANSGAVLQFTEKYPMASGEDAADLLITTSAGNVYVTCVGYEV